MELLFIAYLKDNELWVIGGWHWLEQRLIHREMMRREKKKREEESAQLNFLGSVVICPFLVCESIRFRIEGIYMFIEAVHYNLKTGVDIEELVRDFNELARAIWQGVPGLLSVTAFKHIERKDKAPEWEYTSVFVWQSREEREVAIYRESGVFC